MTTTQKAFNNIQTRIEELKHIEKFVTKGFRYWEVKETIQVLENKLLEIAMQLTAERYATKY